MSAIKVRIQPGKSARSRCRCAIRFDRDWQTVNVDAATEACIRADQMLEVMAEDVAPQSETDEKSFDSTPEAGPAPKSKKARK
jgi:hypothetical protein